MAPVIFFMLVLIFNLKAKAFPLPALEIDSGSGDIDNEALMLGGNSTDNIISSTEHFSNIGTTSTYIHISSEKINSNPATTTNMTGVSESVGPLSTVSSTSLAESTMIDTTKIADISTSTMILSTTKSTGSTGFTETTSFEDITTSENNQSTSISTVASTVSESQSSMVTKKVSTVTSLDTTHVNIDTSSTSVFSTKMDTTLPEVSSSVVTDRVSNSSTYTEPESSNSTSSTATEIMSEPPTTDTMATSDAASFISETSTNDSLTTEIPRSHNDTSTILYASDTTITSNVTSRTTEGAAMNNSSASNANTLLHLAYILPSAFIIVLAIVISVACLCRHRKQTPKTTKQDGGYVMKRQRSFSNPAFMEQNMNALAYQLNSRDSMMPSILRTKLNYHGNSFEDINLSEEDEKNLDVPSGVYFTKQDNSKNLLNEQDISGSVSKSNLSLISVENEKSKYAPRIPGKGKKIENSHSEGTPSHYDILPQRESLPIKQGHNRDQGVANIQSEAAKNPVYDVLPLRTFHNTPHSEVSNKSLENKVSTSEIIPDTHSKLESMDDTPDSNDEEEANSETNLNSLTETNSLNNDENGVFQQEITDIEHVRNEAIYKIREREPATRAPSFVVLPRAPSGSMRTAL